VSSDAQTRTGGIVLIVVSEGDITRVAADALVAALHQNGLWFGRIDDAITGTAGTQFHAQATEALKSDPSIKTIVALKKRPHKGAFGDVVFTVDDVVEPLQNVVLRGLNAAAAADYRTVSMGAIRLGAARNVGGTTSEKIHSIVEAIRAHGQTENPLEMVTIVIFRERNLAAQFKTALAQP